MTKLQLQTHIFLTEKIFKETLAKKLHLTQVVSPLVLDPLSGLNDDLSETEKPVEFRYKDQAIQVIQSGAKWKRQMLYEYEVPMHQGIFIEMNAIRQDESETSKYHSLHVDQYDWEVVISEQERTIAFLKETVKKIWSSFYEAKNELKKQISSLKHKLKEQVFFISSSQLLKRYPHLSAIEREKAIAIKEKVVFIYEIGHKLANGKEHALRAPDYDDWLLNGDLIVYDQINDDALELSSMGIRVDKYAIDKQLKIMDKEHKKHLPFHKKIIEEKLPLSIGGGIGKSRTSMFLLEQKHIQNVQNSFIPK